MQQEWRRFELPGVITSFFNPSSLYNIGVQEFAKLLNGEGKKAIRIKKIALHCNFSVKIMSGTRQRRDTLNANETFTLKVQHVFV